MNKSWLSTLKKGGLSKPSANWLNNVTKFENIFLKVHCNNLKK